MKRICLAAGLAALMLVAGCGKKDTVVRLTEPPEIDHSAIDQYMEYGKADVGTEGLMVTITGTAKAALGKGIALEVDRYVGGTKLDTKPARISQAKEIEVPGGGGAGAPPGAEGTRPPPPAMMQGPPPIPMIEAGDPVRISVDATTTGGKITKLVIRPAGMPMPAPAAAQ